ncbi:hypothetical protein DNTS_009373 [Danionella cerebrum]|uniref:Uncharacterized protein n=1 Tax=Danionella cerebrum TaxID=2873325 RepID=A0A553PX56_9TELE|nr:hypothetical protein DNTS_009373 [Danionella translucida]
MALCGTGSFDPIPENRIGDIKTERLSFMEDTSEGAAPCWPRSAQAGEHMQRFYVPVTAVCRRTLNRVVRSVLNVRELVWAGFRDAGELCAWHTRDLNKPFIRIQLKDCSGVTCLLRVKNQIWVGCQSRSAPDRRSRGKIFVVDTERCTLEKELFAHLDSVQSLCSAEDRYVLSGAAHDDGKIAIWKVE